MSRVLVFDTTCLTHFARAGRLATLHVLTPNDDHLVPPEVMREAQAGLADHPAIGNLYNQSWLQIVELDIIETVRAAKFKAELGGPPNKHLGESEAMAIASARSGVAIIDDADARQTAIRHQIPVAGSLSLVALGLKNGLLDEEQSATLVDDLMATDMRLPTDGSGFLRWATSQGLA